MKLDHFFILSDKHQESAELLCSMGLKESLSRDHEGQGTSNRRFEFCNGMIEILYLRDEKEFRLGKAHRLRFLERIENQSASPFGFLLTRNSQGQTSEPFCGWRYQADYFEPPNAFLIGENSELLHEPLCIYADFFTSLDRKQADNQQTISKIKVHVPCERFSDTMKSLRAVDSLEIVSGQAHLLEVTLKPEKLRQTKDCRPILPLIIHF